MNLDKVSTNHSEAQPIRRECEVLTRPLDRRGIDAQNLATTVGLRDALWIAAACSQVAPLWVFFSPLRGMRDLPMETQPE